LATVYNNVVINDDKSSLKADQINYNFEEKNYKISMYDDKQIKVKIIE